MSYLDPEELEVEFLVCGISSQKPNALSKLANVYSEEETGKRQKQVECHALDPQKELEAISNYASTIGSQIDLVSTEVPVDELRKLFMKSFHWDQRANRFKHSFGDSFTIIPVQNKIHRLFKHIAEQLKIREELPKSSGQPTKPTTSMDSSNNQISAIEDIPLKTNSPECIAPKSDINFLNMNSESNFEPNENFLPPLILRHSNPFFSDIPENCSDPFLAPISMSTTLKCSKSFLS